MINVPVLFRLKAMEISLMVTPERVAELLIADTPGWARVGLTAPDKGLRKRAAEELAFLIYDNLEAPPPHTRDPRQSALWTQSFVRVTRPT